MTHASKTFRVFVSSTFSDLKAERDALQKDVFPRLRELCLAHGYRFQAIDFRWGVSEEATLDQQTMTICLQELQRCQQITPRPNFIVLLGNRYGWCPLPPHIAAEEFETLLAQISPEDRRHLQQWYLGAMTTPCRRNTVYCHARDDSERARSGGAKKRHFVPSFWVRSGR